LIDHAPLVEKVTQMIAALKDHLRRIHDASKKYLFFLSGGYDSRILILLIKQLQDESGLYCNNLTIITHEPEIEVIQEFFKAHPIQCTFLPWKINNQTGVDYYILDTRTNGFCGPQIQTWDLPEKEYSVITGSLGGEQFEYPSPHELRINNQNRQQNTMGNLWFFMKNPAIQLCRDAILWKEEFFPYLSWEYLKVSMTMPKEYFQMETFGKGDMVRNEMMRQLGCKTPLYRGHKYNLQFSPAVLTKFTQEYRESHLYNHFKDHNGHVGMAQPTNTITDKFHIYSRLYGLAKTYERLFE
jgi:hypothetical protein